MFNLLKYELRKTLGLKGIILVITAIQEFLFIFGLYTDNENILTTGAAFLVLNSFIAIFIIGVYSIHLLSKDLNTKQSYMLFMTPNSTYKILGAKVIESSLSIILGGVFFTLLGALDVTLITTKYGSFKDLIDLINMIFGDFVYISPATIISSICVLITFWLYFISVGFLAVVICATYLNGKKHNGILSFLLFLVINGVCQFVINHATALIPTAHMITYATIGSYLALAAGIYFLNAWIMDNQLSV